MRLDRTFYKKNLLRTGKKYSERPYTLNTKTYETSQIIILLIGSIACLYSL